MSGVSLCYIASMVGAVGIAVWGYTDILRKKQSDESDYTEVLSRQAKGFGLLMLAQVFLIVAVALCTGLSGGFDSLSKSVSRLLA